MKGRNKMDRTYIDTIERFFSEITESSYKSFIEVNRTKTFIVPSHEIDDGYEFIFVKNKAKQMYVPLFTDEEEFDQACKSIIPTGVDAVPLELTLEVLDGYAELKTLCLGVVIDTTSTSITLTWDWIDKILNNTPYDTKTVTSTVMDIADMSSTLPVLLKNVLIDYGNQNLCIEAIHAIGLIDNFSRNRFLVLIDLQDNKNDLDFEKLKQKIEAITKASMTIAINDGSLELFNIVKNDFNAIYEKRIS